MSSKNSKRLHSELDGNSPMTKIEIDTLSQFTKKSYEDPFNDDGLNDECLSIKNSSGSNSLSKAYFLK